MKAERVGVLRRRVHGKTYLLRTLTLAAECELEGDQSRDFYLLAGRKFRLMETLSGCVAGRLKAGETVGPLNCTLSTDSGGEGMGLEKRFPCARVMNETSLLEQCDDQ